MITLFKKKIKNTIPLIIVIDGWLLLLMNMIIVIIIPVFPFIAYTWIKKDADVTQVMNHRVQMCRYCAAILWLLIVTIDCYNYCALMIMIIVIIEVAETPTDSGVLQLNVVLDDQKVSRLVASLYFVWQRIHIFGIT